MKTGMKAALVCLLAILLVAQVNGQVKKKNDKPPVKKEEILEPPPRSEELQPFDTSKAKFDVVKDYTEELLLSVDFDTTAAPDDAFTRDILTLLDATNAINMGLTFAENMPREYEGNEDMKEFYRRFIQDMRNGTFRRWQERVYVKEYRKRFTPQDIQELIRFYQSPLGKKLVGQTTELLPGVMEQGGKIGKYIGMKIYMEVLKDKE